MKNEITYIELLAIMSAAMDNGIKAKEVSNWVFKQGIGLREDTIRRHLYAYRYKKSNKKEIPESWKNGQGVSIQIPDHWKKKTQPVNSEASNPKCKEHTQIKHVGEGIEYLYDGYEHSIRTEEQAIEFFQIDLDRWKIAHPTFNVWQTPLKRPDGTAFKMNNYQVKLKCEPREKEIDLVEVQERIALASKKFSKKYKPAKLNIQQEKIGVVCIADLHVGAENGKHKGTLKTLDFSLEILMDYMQQIANQVNSMNYSQVHLACLGDFIESFTGLNHPNSWQGIEDDLVSDNAVIAAGELLACFFSKINNLEKVYMVSGNHDRTTASNKLDVKGGVGKILAYALKLHGYSVEYHHMLLNPVIDRIQYLFTHGHHSFNSKGITNMMLRYGNQTMYMVGVSGHLHSRNTKKEFYKSDGYVYDAVEGRAVTVASLFTGNLYSESIGYTSTAGFSIFEANQQKDNVNHFEFGLGKVKS